jgi:hypothetical protein
LLITQQPAFFGFGVLAFLILLPVVGKYMEITTISAEYAPFWQSGYTPKVVYTLCYKS